MSASQVHLVADASRRSTSSGGSARAAPELDAARGGLGAGGKAQRKDTPTLQVRQRPRLASGATLQWQQLTALCRKNLTIRARSWRTNALVVAQAVLFIFLIWAVDRAVSASRQRQPSFSKVESAEATAVGAVPDCSDSRFMRAGQPCYTFLYAPAGDRAVEAVVAGVRARNQPPIPKEHVMGLANASAVDAWLLAHPETALAAVIFTPENAGSPAATTAGAGALSGMPGGAYPSGFGPGTAVPPSFDLPAAGLSADTAGGDAQAALAAEAWPAQRRLAAVEPLPRPRSLAFAIQTNSSVQWFKGQYQHPNTYMQLPLQVAVEREIVRHLTGDSGLSWSVGLAPFPHPAVKSPSLIGQFAPTFLFASIMFQFVLLVHDVVAEKEGRGLLAALEACLLVGFGYAFGFKLFTRNAFGLSFFLILLVCLATSALGFLASVAVPAGFLLFVVAWVILILVAGGIPYSPSYSPRMVAAFSAMPWSLLAKGVQDLAAASEGQNPGIRWADRDAYCQRGTALPPGVQLAGSYWREQCVVPLGQMYWMLAAQTAAFMALAIYLDAVLPDANGVRRPPWFFLLPSYWRRGSGRGSIKAAARALAAPTEADEGLSVDPDVAEETLRRRKRCAAYVASAGGALPPASASAALPAQEAVLPSGAAATKADGDGSLRSTPKVAAAAGVSSGGAVEGDGEELAGAERPYAVEMFGLRKAYKASRGAAGILRRRKPFVAVRGNWLGVHQGECFCLLGPNGAGKSTTINCLTGVLPFTGGDALVCGTSLAGAGGMDRVRPLMGVCPQFDVLWPELTGREHLQLFGAIKGLPARERGPEAARLLEDVRLGEAAGVRAGAYSGGMKRRLSVVYLDEPTTGLDPISRRHLWDLVDREKRGRAIVLTTHSMEEADILGDRIAIMARGRLRCLGTSLRLKARFGSGYRVSIRLAGADADASAGGLADAYGSSAGSAAANLLFEGSEIQPAPQQQAQQQRRDSPSGDSAAGRDLHLRDAATAAQAAAVRGLFMAQLGIKPTDESSAYLHFLVRYEHEERLPALFARLKADAAVLGVADVQLRLTPLEEVFLTVARKAELEHAQQEGRQESLALAEEGISVQVPLGADLIQSPAGHLYHIRWGQDADTGELRLRDYWRDPVSAAALQPEADGGSEAGEGSDGEEGGDSADEGEAAAV